MKLALPFLATAASAFAALPSVGPDYQRPTSAKAAPYRDAGEPGAWKSAAPADALERGEWWKIYGDATLDGLESGALAANQDLRGAVARVEEASASAGLARSAYWPQAALNADAVRERFSPNAAVPYPNTVVNDFNVPMLASWELDIFGRVRRLNESARADAQASASLFESVRLSLTSEVAADYF